MNAPLRVHQNPISKEAQWTVVGFCFEFKNTRRNTLQEGAANHWIKRGVAREKLIIGIPTYGRGWTLADTKNFSLGASGSASKATQFVQFSGTVAYFEVSPRIFSQNVCCCRFAKCWPKVRTATSIRKPKFHIWCTAISGSATTTSKVSKSRPTGSAKIILAADSYGHWTLTILTENVHRTPQTN